MGNDNFNLGDEIWDGAVAIIAFDDDGTKYLMCQSGIRMSADQQLKLADELRQNALKNYDSVEAIRQEQKRKLLEEWRSYMDAPREVKTKAVYLMKAGNDYKVGVSNDPQRRLEDILRHRPDVELIAYSKLHPEEANVIASWIQEAE